MIACAGGSGIRLLVDGVEISVDKGFDGTTLSEVLNLLKARSCLVLITDYSGSVDPMAFIYLRSDLNYAERFRPPFRHGNVMNVAFPDGHAEGVRRPEQPSGLDAGWLFASPVNQ